MKNRIKYLPLFFLVLMSMSLVSSSQLGTFKQYEDITLYQMCDNCSYVNLTSIKYPDSIIQTVGENMVKSGEDYTYIFTSPDKIGDYQYTVCGDKDGTVICEVIDFDITPSGFAGTLGFYFLILLLSGGVIVLGFSKEDAPIVILGSFGLYFVGLYILFFGVDGFKDPIYTWALGIIILMLAAYISVRSAYELIVD